MPDNPGNVIGKDDNCDPWAIRSAIAVARLGDIVRVKLGTYQEGIPGDTNAITITQNGMGSLHLNILSYFKIMEVHKITAFGLVQPIRQMPIKEILNTRHAQLAGGWSMAFRYKAYSQRFCSPWCASCLCERFQPVKQYRGWQPVVWLVPNCFSTRHRGQ